jgi:hypothetical protein
MATTVLGRNGMVEFGGGRVWGGTKRIGLERRVSRKKKHELFSCLVVVVDNYLQSHE